jgi:molybdate transport system substrate-binding protein
MNVPARNRKHGAPAAAALFAGAAALVFGCALLPTASNAATVTVFAAASLKDALDEQARHFEAETRNKVVVSYGGSNALAAQIEAGAPADVFISADLDWMDHVEHHGALVPGSRKNLLRNELVLIAPATSKMTLRIARDFDLAGALGAEKLAIANPDSVPAGKYGKAALTALGVWINVAQKTARTDNVRIALSLVARGEAALGIVYKSDALADKSVRIVDIFPEATHAPIVYPGALVATSKGAAAKAFLDFLSSAPARPIWEKYGFTAL